MLDGARNGFTKSLLQAPLIRPKFLASLMPHLSTTPSKLKSSEVVVSAWSLSGPPERMPIQHMTK